MKQHIVICYIALHCTPLWFRRVLWQLEDRKRFHCLPCLLIASVRVKHTSLSGPSEQLFRLVRHAHTEGSGPSKNPSFRPMLCKSVGHEINCCSTNLACSSFSAISFIFPTFNSWWCVRIRTFPPKKWVISFSTSGNTSTHPTPPLFHPLSSHMLHLTLDFHDRGEVKVCLQPRGDTISPVPYIDT